MKDNYSKYINVILPIPVDAPLIYKLPENSDIPQKGCRVLVPLKGRKIPAVGISFGLSDPKIINNISQGIEIKTLYNIIDDKPIIPISFVDFIEWASKYYCHPLGMVFEEALPSDVFSSTKKAIDKIIKSFEKNKEKKDITPDFIKWIENPPLLTDEQKICLEKVDQTLSKKKFSPFLLFGVTGSGKTEVYINAVKRCIETKKNALVMVPEIAMTSQIVSRFMNRFNNVAVFHSGLTNPQKLSSWNNARKGNTSIVIGTRSSIFTPMQNIGLIIVDEEHDPSYKQDHGFRYNARDLAIVRAQKENATVILGSATPSISSNYNVLVGKYSLISLTKRIGKGGFPSVTIVDKKNISEKNDTLPYWLNQTTYDSINETLENKEQVLIFLNKRGFATYIFCEDCGFVFTCSNCSVTYTWHKSINKKIKNIETEGVLRCHYCGDEKPSLPLCPRCKSLTIKSTGYGTERIMIELTGIFPKAIIDRLDRDVITSKNRLENVLDKFRNKETDILIGTQMVTKGHDFPNLTLVCILMADFSFNLPEFNASEKAFQLISQVSGRSGRGEKPGKVIIQTYNPNNQVINFAINQNYNDFYNFEITKRKKYGYPPFEKILLILFSGKSEPAVKKIALDSLIEIEKIKKMDIFNDSMTLFGPSPSPINRIDNRFRWQIMIKVMSNNLFLRSLDMIYPKISKFKKGSVRVEFDIDPVSML